MTDGRGQAAADDCDRIQILGMPEALELATADGLVEQGHAAIARHARLLLLDLAGLSFCDARGLGALVRIANHADSAGCRYGLVAPQPQVRKILRLSRLDERLRVFESIDDARGYFTAISQP